MGLPPPPAEISVVSHWLAIDGVQPKIMENMPTVEAVNAVTAAAAGTSCFHTALMFYSTIKKGCFWTSCVKIEPQIGQILTINCRF